MAKYDLPELFPFVAAKKSDYVLLKKREKIVEIVRENVSKNKKIFGRNIDLQSFVQKLKEDNKYWPSRTSVPSSNNKFQSVSLSGVHFFFHHYWWIIVFY